MSARMSMIARLAGGTLVVFAMMQTIGCYRHVVGVEGAGTGDVKIYEPNLKEPGDNQSTSSKSVPTKTVPSKRAP